MSRGIVVVGTDTEIGKTFIAGHLCRIIRESGVDCGVYKPVQSGSPGLAHPGSDAATLRRLSGLDEPVEDLCAYSFPDPLAPPIAAARAGVELTLDMLLAPTRAALSRHELTLVETAGGFLSPTAAGATVADFAKAVDLPVLLVARAGLGTVNHTLLTLEAIRSRGLHCLGVILNQAVGALAETDNPGMIREFGKTRILGVVPQEADAAAIAAAVREVWQHVKIL